MTIKEYRIFKHCVLSRAHAISRKTERETRSLLQVLIALVIFKSEETDNIKLTQYSHDIKVIIADIEESLNK